MKSRKSFLLVLMAALGLCSACGARRPAYDAELVSYGPFLVDGGLCYLNHTLGELIRISPLDGRLDTERVFTAQAPLALSEVVDGALLAILHNDQDSPGITLIRSDTLHEEAWLSLGEQFDRLAISPTSRFGVAFFSGQSSPSAGIRNMNQIQVLDFVNNTAHQPLALQTGGLSPRGIDFLPAGSGDFDDVAVVLVDNGLVIVDLHDLEAQPLWVRFTNAPGGLAVPAQVVFGSFTRVTGGYIFVRLQGSDDVLSIHLVRDAGRLQRTINFLNTPVDSRPTDLLTLPIGQFADKVFVVYGSGEGSAAILDANAIQTDEQFFSFDGSVDSAERLLGSDGRELIAAYQSNSTTARLFVVDPATGEVETVQFQDRFDRLEVPREGSHLVVFHPNLSQTATPGMRVVRMEPHATSGRLTHRIATYSLDAKLSAFAFSSNQRTMLAALQNELVAFQLDLETGGYGSLELDRLPVAAGLVPGANWSYFQHQHPLGSLTLVPLNKFDRDHAIMLEGFMLGGLLDPDEGGGS